MSQQSTRDAILRGTYYERVIKPLCDADKRAKAAAEARAIKAARFRARSCKEIAALGEP